MGGNHGQRALSERELEELKKILRETAMLGSKQGSGWTSRAVRVIIEERFGVRYRGSGVRKILGIIGWSYQRGRKLYIRRTDQEQVRYELETLEALEKYAESGEQVTPIAADQTKIYLEGTVSRRWNPAGEQPLIADGARSKQCESIYGGCIWGPEKKLRHCVLIGRIVMRQFAGTKCY